MPRGRRSLGGRRSGHSSTPAIGAASGRAPVSKLEDQLARQIAGAGLPTPDREVTFHAERRWRFDFAWPAAMVALEVEGATWAGGRHTRGKGFAADCEKYNEAAVMGWTVLRVTGDMVRKGKALEIATRALALMPEWG